jgi:hypothetical protein
MPKQHKLEFYLALQNARNNRYNFSENFQFVNAVSAVHFVAPGRDKLEIAGRVYQYTGRVEAKNNAK